MNDKVLRQQEKVRRSGEVNMFDIEGVQRTAHEMDFHALFTFIEELRESPNRYDVEAYVDMAERSAEKYRDADEL